MKAKSSEQRKNAGNDLLLSDLQLEVLENGGHFQKEETPKINTYGGVAWVKKALGNFRDSPYKQTLEFTHDNQLWKPGSANALLFNSVLDLDKVPLEVLLVCLVILILWATDMMTHGLSELVGAASLAFHPEGDEWRWYSLTFIVIRAIISTEDTVIMVRGEGKRRDSYEVDDSGCERRWKALEGEYSQAEEILLDQKKRYLSMPSLPGEWGDTFKEGLREFYTLVCYCFGDLYRAQKQWAKAVPYYQEGLELFRQCELVEGFDNDSEDLKKETADARKNLKECSDRVGKK
ncbi:hypothetical protein IW262DRAFT_1301124 [Armillaria fumosa]|nr:hypothetical protein IW262DRAFT_1301124 [Armillaria fumosa]